MSDQLVTAHEPLQLTVQLTQQRYDTFDHWRIVCLVGCQADAQGDDIASVILRMRILCSNMLVFGPKVMGEPLTKPLLLHVFHYSSVPLFRPLFIHSIAAVSSIKLTDTARVITSLRAISGLQTDLCILQTSPDLGIAGTGRNTKLHNTSSMHVRLHLYLYMYNIPLSVDLILSHLPAYSH